jgi:hypothetical protein
LIPSAPLIFLAGTEDKSHFDEKFVSVLADLRLVPEDVAEEGEARAEDQVELHFPLVDQVGLGKLGDVEAPA